MLGDCLPTAAFGLVPVSDVVRMIGDDTRGAVARLDSAVGQLQRLWSFTKQLCHGDAPESNAPCLVTSFVEGFAQRPIELHGSFPRNEPTVLRDVALEALAGLRFEDQIAQPEANLGARKPRFAECHFVQRGASLEVALGSG